MEKLRFVRNALAVVALTGGPAGCVDGNRHEELVSEINRLNAEYERIRPFENVDVWDCRDLITRNNDAPSDLKKACQEVIDDQERESAEARRKEELEKKRKLCGSNE